jgi:ABC-2 type transport system permease protein
MWSIYRKELAAFFSNVTGYLTIGVFLLVIGLFMWIFSETNVIDYGQSTMDQLFSIAPLIFLFLIPALTMRSFAEEKQTGTIEFLYTKPLSAFQIILGKYLSYLTLVFLAILPTLVYYYSIYQLGSPKGNLDSGAIIGSYIGLFFLAGAFVAIGIFASALTENLIVAFVTGAALCFVMHWALGYFANLRFWPENVKTFINGLGINFHYSSISKGALYLKDILYFLSIIAVFILGTHTVIDNEKS